MEPVTPGGNPKSKWKLYAIAGVIGVVVILYIRSKSSGGSGSASPTSSTAGQTSSTTVPSTDAQNQFAAIDAGITSLETAIASSQAGGTQPAVATSGLNPGGPVSLNTSSAPSSDFVSQLYQRYLGRSPDAGGATYWQGDLASNVGSMGAVAGQAKTEQQFAAASSTEQATRKLQ